MTSRKSEEIVEDSEKGASELLEDVLESIEDLEEDEVTDYLETLVRERYTMTPLVNLANQIFISIEKECDIEKQIHESKKEFVSRRKKAARKMKRVLETGQYSKVLTLSRSSTVLQILSDAEKAVLLESRPMKESRVTAKKLAEKGVEVEYWVDAGICKALEGADCAVIGADTILKEGFLNKIGSRPLAIVSEKLGKDLYVVADSSKILPEEVPSPEGESHPPQEVWDSGAEVDVKNDYFELTELKRATFVTEDGIKSSQEIKKIAEEKRVSRRLLEIHPLI